jgi:hypothetical protein
MIKVELTDDELITIISFLARSIRDSGSLSETQLWKKLREARIEYQMSPEFRNSVADAVGEGDSPCEGCAGCPPASGTNNEQTIALVNPFDLPAGEYEDD